MWDNLRLAAREGMQPAQFWRVTPRELDTWLSGRIDALRDRAAAEMSLAWHTAAFHRAPKKLPDLQPIIRRIMRDPEKPIAAQSPQEAVRVVEHLNRLFGGVDKRPERKRNRS